MEVYKHINSFFHSVSYRLDRCLIDPGDIWDEFYNIETVLLTHAHFDHIYGLNKLIEANPNAKVYTNDAGKRMLFNARLNMSLYNNTEFEFLFPDNVELVSNNEIVRLQGGILSKAIFTPGHNPSCITWLIDNMAFTGDSYIPGVKVVTNLPGGNKEQAQESLDKIMKHSNDIIFYPGHEITKLELK